jgi:hypothetical protein
MAQPSVSDLAYRTLAGVVGGPVDLTTMVMRPFGYKTPDESVIGGSEWIGKQMERAGLVSSARAPIQEFLASLTVPTPSGVGKGLAMGAPALAGIFVGKGSRTWDALNAQKAKDLEKAGVDPKTIWQETGTWKGPDGKWRQEIGDQPAQITDDVFYGIKEKQRFEGPMSKALSHEELYKAYPDTREIRSGFYAWRTPEGQYDRATDTITAGGPGTTSQKSAAIHELQHAIQQREGFAKGGSNAPSAKMEEAISNDLENLLTRDPKAESLYKRWAKFQNDIEMGKDFDPKVVESLEKQLETTRFGRQIIDRHYTLEGLADPRSAQSAANDYYRRLAGEAEARAVQARMNMNPAQRRATFPPESYDVDIDSLIMRGLE